MQPTCAEVPLPWPHCTSKHAPQSLMSSWWAKELLGPSAAMHVGGRVAGGVWSMGALPEAIVNRMPAHCTCTCGCQAAPCTACCRMWPGPPPVLMPGQLLYVRSTVNPQAPSLSADELLEDVPLDSACARVAGWALDELLRRRPRWIVPAEHVDSLAAWRRRRLPPSVAAETPPGAGQQPQACLVPKHPCACLARRATSNRVLEAAGGHSPPELRSWWRWLLSTRSGAGAGAAGLLSAGRRQPRGPARAGQP